jgi:signal transduction histidine kinase
MQEPSGADRPANIEIIVEDDGKAVADLSPGSGMGLLGMRERIVALGGRLSMDTSRPRGLVLHARIPVPSAITHASGTRQAA